MTRPKRSLEGKRRDQRLGFLAEAAAEIALRFKGCRILARRWSSRHGEIDLIARRGDLILFVEVKARADFDAALASITGAKRDKLERSIRAWISGHDGQGRHSYRADAMLVAPWRWPRHVPGVFEIRGL